MLVKEVKPGLLIGSYACAAIAWFIAALLVNEARQSHSLDPAAFVYVIAFGLVLALSTVGSLICLKAGRANSTHTKAWTATKWLNYSLCVLSCGVVLYVLLKAISWRIGRGSR